MLRWATTALLAATMLGIPMTASAAPDAASDSVQRPIEALRLDCQPVTRSTVDRLDDPTIRYGVACRWAVPTADVAASVRLLRLVVGSDQPRTQIFATRNLAENTYLDAPVRPDRRYAYRVQALNSNGRVVGSSRTVTVAVPSVDIEPLRLQCRAADSDDSDDSATRTRIGCRWTLPTVVGARTLTLWRSVDQGPRERVVSFDQRFASSYRDVVPAASETVAYAVIATNGDGDIVARSRADIVDLGHSERPAVAVLASASRLDTKGSAG